MILVKSMGEAQGPCVRAKVGEEPEGSSTLEEGGGGRLQEAGRARPVDRGQWFGHPSGCLKHLAFKVERLILIFF